MSAPDQTLSVDAGSSSRRKPWQTPVIEDAGVAATTSGGNTTNNENPAAPSVKPGS